MDISLENSIIIIDEAHNIMQAAEEIIEIEIKNSDILNILQELELLEVYCNG